MRKVMLSIFTAALALTVNAAAVITPEGEPKQYELSALYMGQEAVKLNKMAMQVSWSDDSTRVYFCDLFIYYRTAGTGIWTQGNAVKKEDGTRTVTIPLQYVNEYTSDKGVSHLYVGGALDEKVTTLGDYKLTYNPEDGSFTAEDLSQYLVYAQIEKNTQTKELEIVARVAYHNQMTLTQAGGDLKLITPPSIAKQVDYEYNYYDQNATTKKIKGSVAINGKDVYFKGLCPDYDSWVKGTADEVITSCTSTTVVHIPTNQYLGNTDFYNMYFRAAHEKEGKEGEYSTYDFTTEVTLTYNATDETYTLTPKDLCIEGLYGETSVKAVNYSFKLEKFNSEAETNPVAPTNVQVMEIEEYEDTPYCTMFYIENKGENGDILDTDNLYYRVYINGDPVKHEEFESSSDDTTLVPYSYSGGNYGTASARHWWYFPYHLCSNLGVQQVYIKNGKEFSSGIVTIPYAEPAKEDDLDASEVAATAKSVYLGYCDEKIASTTEGKIGCNHATGTYDCAIMLTKKNLDKYKGSNIKSVRVGMPEGSDSYPTIKAWVRKKLNGENMAQSGETQTQAGWNTVYLQNDVTINEGDTLYIGYTYSQTMPLNTVSLAGNTTSKGSYITHVGGETYSYANRAWGSLSIEAEIFGGQAITNDIRLTALKPEYRMVKKGEKVVLRGSVKNMGISELTGYSITYKIGSTTSMEYVNRPLDVRTEDDFTIEYSLKNPTVQNDIPVEVHVDLLGGLTDDLPQNNDGNTTFCIYDETFPRNVLIEEFTTEQCGWCPRGAHMLHEAVKEFEGSRVYWNCYHAGFGTDFMTTSEHEEFLKLYGDTDETFAPAMAVNRSSDILNKSGVVDDIPANVEETKKLLQEGLNQPAFTSITTEGQMTGRTANIKVSLEKNVSLLGQCAEPRLTVMILEDSIPQQSQHNYAATEYPYTHHTNVLRKVLTSQWGQQIEWDGDKAEYTFVYDVPEGYDINRLKAVALIHDYGNSMQVLNCGGCDICNTEGITEITDERSEVSEQTYNLAGQRVDKNKKGIVIRKHRSFLQR